MNERLNELVYRAAAEENCEDVGPVSTGERCFIALSAQRYDLLPEAYADPVEAWHRLDGAWQARVCMWRDWPLEWAREQSREAAANSEAAQAQQMRRYVGWVRGLDRPAFERLMHGEGHHAGEYIEEKWSEFEEDPLGFAMRWSEELFRAFVKERPKMG